MVNRVGDILLVDDDEAVRATLTKCLLRSGYKVRAASNAEEATISLDDHPCDVVVLDLRMPRMDGLEWLKTRRPKLPGPEIIMITGFPSIDTAIEFMRLGGFDYLPKPLAMRQFAEKVNAAVERRRMRVAAEHTVAQQERLAESLPMAVIEIALDGRVRYASPRAASILGYERTEFETLSLDDLYVQPADVITLRQRLADSGIHSCDCPMRHRDGHQVWVRTTARAISLHTEMVLVGLFEDLSREREMTAVITKMEEAAESLRARMVALRRAGRERTAQEFEQALRPTLEQLRRNLARLGQKKSKECKEWPDEILNMARTVEKGMTVLGELVRVEAPPQTPQRLQDVVNEAVGRLRENCSLPIEQVLKDADEIIDIDSALNLRYVLCELLDNVVRHAAATRVRIHAEKVKGDLLVEIRDNGRGITQEQIDSPESLGLAGVRATLRAGGGALEIMGNERGTSARVVLPLSPMNGAKPTGQVKVVLATACDLLRLALRQLFMQRFGTRTAEVGTGRELRDAIWGKPWDLVVVDASLTAGLTSEVVHEIREEQREARIIVVTGSKHAFHVKEVLEAGANGCMTHDCAEEQWRQAIEAVLEGRTYVAAKLADELVVDGKELHQRLSEREFEVLCSIGAGKSVRQIAATAARSEVTVRKTRRNLLRKMRMQTDAQLVRYALERGLVE